MTEDRISSTHPQIPPTTEETRLSRLRLLRSRRVGATTFHKLMQTHHTAEAALCALPMLAQQAGVSRYTICPEERAARELEDGRALGAHPIFIGDADYPVLLAQLPDAPPLLWARGDLSLLRRPLISLVGARNASSLGTRMARKLAANLGAEGLVVVSGLARGIDTAAHTAALPTGTIAVFAGGLARPYPTQNHALAAQIAQTGLCLSEQPPTMEPRARHFPARNRIISGLARAVVVVEAASKSGSLITARNALDQGREVLAVPGHPFDARASGCNMLIRDGAVLVRTAADVLDILGQLEAPLVRASKITSQSAPVAGGHDPHPSPASAPRNLRQTAALHMQILDHLGPSPVSEDQLIRDLGAVPSDIGPALIDLELDGKIARHTGGLLSRL